MRTKNHRGHKRRGHTIRRKSRAHGNVIMRGGACECYTELSALQTLVRENGLKADRIIAEMKTSTNKLIDNLVIIAKNTAPRPPA